MTGCVERMLTQYLLTPIAAVLGRMPKTREEIVALQQQQLRRLVTHAYKNVPYYRRLFDRQGIKPHDIRTVADLSAIPVTTKKDLQAVPIEDIVARGVDPRRLITRTTSGSSGEPFTIRRTWLETRLLQAFRIRAMRDFGLQITDKLVSVVLQRSPHPQEHSFPLRLLRTLGMYRMQTVNCLLPPTEIVQVLRQLRPQVLGGFAGILARIAQSVGETDRQMIRPRFVAVGGDVMTSLMRCQISNAFAAPVFDMYSSQEFILIAWECPETGEFHTCDDSVIVEVLKDGVSVTEGERGEVVGTNLYAFAMPLIRYRLGDLVTKGTDVCRCGKPFSTIRGIQGRMIDYFLLPNGRAVHPYEIVVPLLHEGEGWIGQYQLLQERENRLTLRIVPSAEPASSALNRVETMMTSILGPEIEARIILVPDIPLEPSGKFRVSRSLLHSTYDGLDWQAWPPHQHSSHDEKGRESQAQQ